MTAADRYALKRLVGDSPRATTDDLQNLLLQVVLALLMVFMIAYFLFVHDVKKDRAEEVMELNRQKLTLALDRVAEEHRVRYGLNALMVEGVDGKRTFEPDDHVRGGQLALAPAARTAFASGANAAFADYSDSAAVATNWCAQVLDAAGLEAAKLDAPTLDWLGNAIARETEAVRLDVRGVQRALAARLQKQWVEDPSAFADERDPVAVAEALKRRSLRLVADAIGGEVLP